MNNKNITQSNEPDAENPSENESQATTEKKSFWRRLPRWFRIITLAIVSIIVLISILVGTVSWYFNPSVDRIDGVVYGHRNEKPLELDVIRPKNPNGLGVAVMVSGSWKSAHGGVAPVPKMAPLIRNGYTVFAVYHISQPEATVMEIIEDVQRSIRFIKHHAEEYGVDPERIGVTGSSAGGHLSLMLATTGGPGPQDAKDPVDRESSAVHAVAIFFPVTDLLNITGSSENLGDGGPPKNYVKAFGPDSTDLKKWKVIGRRCSPIYHITKNLPPTLIHHGEADTLVPLDQSIRFQERAAEIGIDVNLVVHPDKNHGWESMPWDYFAFADWFDQHLKSETK